MPDNEEQIFVNEKELLHELVSGAIQRTELEKAIDDANITFIKCESDRKAFRHFQKTVRRVKRGANILC